MTNTVRRRVAGALGVALLMAASYAAGAVQTKQPRNVPIGDLKWEPFAPGTPLQVAVLWGNRQKGPEYGMLLKLPAGFDSGMHSHTADYHAVSVQGTWVHTNEGGAARELPPGSYALQPGKQDHSDSCKGTTDCILFVHQHAPGDVLPGQSTETK